MSRLPHNDFCNDLNSLSLTSYYIFTFIIVKFFCPKHPLCLLNCLLFSFFFSRCTLVHSPISSNQCCLHLRLRNCSACWDISSVLDMNSFAFSHPDSVLHPSVTSSACRAHFSWLAVSAACSWRLWGSTLVRPSGSSVW